MLIVLGQQCSWAWPEILDRADMKYWRYDYGVTSTMVARKSSLCLVSRFEKSKLHFLRLATKFCILVSRKCHHNCIKCGKVDLNVRPWEQNLHFRYLDEHGKIERNLAKKARGFVLAWVTFGEVSELMFRKCDSSNTTAIQLHRSNT